MCPHPQRGDKVPRHRAEAGRGPHEEGRPGLHPGGGRGAFHSGLRDLILRRRQMDCGKGKYRAFCI